MAAKPRRDVQKELDELRAQVEALAAAQKERSAAAEPEAQATPEPPEEERDLVKSFEDLFQSLQQDLNETPTTTCLAIFALGILVGRALAA